MLRTQRFKKSFEALVYARGLEEGWVRRRVQEPAHLLPKLVRGLRIWIVSRWYEHTDGII